MPTSETTDGVAVKISDESTQVNGMPQVGLAVSGGPTEIFVRKSQNVVLRYSIHVEEIYERGIEMGLEEQIQRIEAEIDNAQQASLDNIALAAAIGKRDIAPLLGVSEEYIEELCDRRNSLAELRDKLRAL